jgi:predicted small secreted protein
MIKKIVLTALALFILTILTSCNTMQGLGKDIKGAGEAIEDAADGKD